MFESFDEAEIPIPIQVKKAGQHTWSVINIQLHMPWYFVCYSKGCLSLNGSQKNIISLFQQIDQLVALNQSQDVSISEVKLISPSYLNGKNSWEMEPIKEIWTATEPRVDTQQTAFIYVLQSGKRYIDSNFGTSEIDLINPTLSFNVAFKH